MIGLIEIRDLLRSEIGPGKTQDMKLDQCNVAASIESIMKHQTKVDYSLHVIPTGARGQEGGSTGMAISRVEDGVLILIGVKDVSDAIGSEGQDTLKQYRKAVAETLQGFTPTDTSLPLRYTDGDLIDFKDGIFWQAEKYTGGYNIREVV